MTMADTNAVRYAGLAGEIIACLRANLLCGRLTTE